MVASNAKQLAVSQCVSVEVKNEQHQNKPTQKPNIHDYLMIKANRDREQREKNVEKMRSIESTPKSNG